MPPLRHPGAILQRATDELFKTFEEVLHLYDEVMSVKDLKVISRNNKNSDLLKQQEHLFCEMDSFQDECYLMLKSLCPVPATDNAPGKKFVYEWLQKNSYQCGADFLNKGGNTQKFIDEFSNRFKHANQKIDFMCGEIDGIFVLGFFIEEAKGFEVKKAYPIIPDTAKNATIGFSFNRMLKNLLLCFYLICDDMDFVVKRHIKNLHSIKIEKGNVIQHTKRFFDVVKRIADIDDYYFAYEYYKFPRFKFEKELLTITCPHGDRQPYHGNMKLVSLYNCDGYTKDFPLAFVGPR